jgi:hypothetical protein
MWEVQAEIHSFPEIKYEPIFIKCTLALQTCVNNYNTKFHENPTNGGVTDTRPWTERQRNVASTKKYSFLYCKECLNAV